MARLTVSVKGLEPMTSCDLRNVGVDPVLLGSDYPQLTLAQTLDALEHLGLDENEKAKIPPRECTQTTEE